MTAPGARWPGDPVPLTIAPSRPHGAVARVRIEGELDMAVCDTFLRRVRDAVRPGTPFEIDLRGLTFLDSTGTRALVAADRLARDAGATAVRVRILAGGSVSRVLQMLGAGHVLDVEAG